MASSFVFLEDSVVAKYNKIQQSYPQEQVSGMYLTITRVEAKGKSASIMEGITTIKAFSKANVKAQVDNMIALIAEEEVLQEDAAMRAS